MKYQSLGLTRNESDVFENILKQGMITVSDLILKTGLHRNICYEIIGKLQQKGFIYEIRKEKKRYYQVSQKEVFDEFLKEERKELDETRRVVEQVKKKRRDNIPDAKTNVSVLKGKQGLRALAKMLLEVRHYKVLGAPKGVLEVLPAYFWKNFLEKRTEKNIKAEMILSEKLRRWVKETRKTHLDKIRFVKDFENDACETVIFEDKVAIVFLADEPKITILQHPQAVKHYETIFDMLWQIASK